jgi:hypothetical protein
MEIIERKKAAKDLTKHFSSKGEQAELNWAFLLVLQCEGS